MIARRGAARIDQGLRREPADKTGYSYPKIPVLHVGRGCEFARGAGSHYAPTLDQKMAVGDMGERIDVLVDH